MNFLLENARVISPGVDLPGASVHVRNGKVEAIYPQGFIGRPSGLPSVDLAGNWLVPGFIDIHAHGANGADVCEARLAGLETIAHAKLGEGVTTWLPTTLTLPQADLREILATVEAFRQSGPPLSVPGLHLEGPFLNPRCAGAQNPAYIQLPDLASLEKLSEITPLSILSLATEMPGGLEMVRWATGRGITCSLAHSAATYAEFLAAKTAGLKHLTHFTNQMTPLHHREIGLVGAGLLDPDVRLELICDGIHVAPDMLRLIFATKPIGQLMLITDSIAASHLGDGSFQLGGLTVEVSNKSARLASGNLAGSTLLYPEGLQRVQQITNRPLSELIATTGWNQAQSLSWRDRGKIAPGFRADFALLRPDFTVAGTWVAGTHVFGVAPS